jgi:hypothetical protein
VVPVEQIAVEGAEFGRRHVHLAEHVFRLLHFLAEPYIPVFHAGRPFQVVHAVHPLQRHGDPLEPIGQLGGNRREFEPAGLLEVGELGNFHPVEHHLPANAPGAERRRFPVVLFEPDVVLPRVDAARLEALQIELLHLVRRRLQNDLELMVLERAVRVFPEAAVRRTSGGLHVGDIPMRRPEHAEKGLGVHGPGTHLEVERLLQGTTPRCPELGQL